MALNLEQNSPFLSASKRKSKVYSSFRNQFHRSDRIWLQINRHVVNGTVLPHPVVISASFNAVV
jgi:hypothetical protein